MPRAFVTCLLISLAMAGCGDDDADAPAEGARAELDFEGEPIDPPFEVRGEAEGLLLVWYDEEGPHSAERRADVPEAYRQRVRVDSLTIPPEDRLDAELVYVADLRAEVDGRYPIRTLRRDAFDELVDRAAGTARPSPIDPGAPNPPTAAGGDADVIIYGADWCGACRSAAGFFRSRGVAFVEKNIERDRQALTEMQDKARRAGVRPSGIPVIDFRGTIIAGFDQARIESLMGAGGSGRTI